MSRRTRRVVGQNLRLGVLPYTVIPKDAGKAKADGESKSDAKEAVFLLWKNFRPTLMQSTGFWGELVCEKVKSDDTALTTIARVISAKTQGAFGDADSTLTAKERITNCQKRLQQKLNKKVGVYIISRGDHMLYLVPVRYVAQSPLTDLCNHKDGGYVRWVSANSLIDTVCSQTPSAMLCAKSIQGETLPLYLPFVSLLRADSVAHDLASFLEQYGVAQPTAQPPDERNSTFTVVASASADGVRMISAVDESSAAAKGRKSSTRSANSESNAEDDEDADEEDAEADGDGDGEEEEVEETEDNVIDLGDVDEEEEEEEEDCCDDEECSGHGHDSESKSKPRAKKGHLPKPQTALVAEPTVSFSCRRCRRALFTDADLVVHEALKKWEGGGLGLFRNKKKSSLEQNLSANMECTSLFLSEAGLRQLQGASIAAQRVKAATASATPAPTSDAAALNEDVCFSFAESEGNILCPNPKCLTRVGTYNWAGEQCSCGGWVTPFLQVVKSKVDPKPLKGHSVPTAYTDARERSSDQVETPAGAAQPTIVRPAIVRPVIFRPPPPMAGTTNV